jgi:hypothetical protein
MFPVSTQCPSASRCGSARRCAVWLFVSFQAFYLLTSSGRFHTIDEYETFYITESVAERAVVSLPDSKAFYGRRGRDGEFYAPYGPLPALAAVPGFLAARELGEALALSSTQRECLLWLFTCAANSTVSAAAVVVFFTLARRLGAKLGAALGAALVLGLATPHWHYATTYFSEPLAALLLLLAALRMMTALAPPHGATAATAPSPRLAALACAGGFLALLVPVRLTHAVYFPLFGLAVLCGPWGSWRRIAAAASFSALPAAAVALHLFWNLARFGDAFQLGYPDTADGGLAPSGFTEPALRGLYGLTLSPGKGLAVFAAPVLVALLGSRELLRRSRTAIWLLLLPLAALALYSKYSYWEGGYSWGPRYLVPALPFWILPLAFLDLRGAVLRSSLAAVVLFSAAFQALGVSVSFLECQVERGYYAPGFRYDLGYSALAETASVFAHYLGEALRGNFLSEPQGQGFDRWFFVLAKEGVDGETLGAAAAVLFGALCVSAWRLRVSMRSALLSLPESATPPARGRKAVRESIVPEESVAS